MNTPRFKSFMMGGFECAAPRQEDKRRIDSLALTRHDELCREDYRLLKELGIWTVREGFVWAEIDKGNGVYDFSRFEKMLAIGRDEGIEQIWDLNHFDYPDHLDPFTDEFIGAFARYARRCAELIKKYEHGPIYIVPINEISFFSFMAASVALWAPYARSAGYRFKQQLVRASIAAMDAMWEVDPNIRFIQVDPIFRRIPARPPTIVTQAMADAFNETKFQTFDMLMGRLMPELGGNLKYVDIIGANYYIYNQEWITGEDLLDAHCHKMMPLDSSDRVPLKDMLQEVADRYPDHPIVLTETGCIGDLRVPWWKLIFREVDDALAAGIPLFGVCAYPVIDRPDWHDLHLTNSGFWDFEKGDKKLRRIPHEETLGLVREYIRKKNAGRDKRG
jgi:beta-glucosidase/6-phospho-beta-glucosidase/beta-galactosidase